MSRSLPQHAPSCSASAPTLAPGRLVQTRSNCVVQAQGCDEIEALVSNGFAVASVRYRHLHTRYKYPGAQPRPLTSRLHRTLPDRLRWPCDRGPRSHTAQHTLRLVLPCLPRHGACGLRLKHWSNLGEPRSSTDMETGNPDCGRLGVDWGPQARVGSCWTRSWCCWIPPRAR